MYILKSHFPWQMERSLAGKFRGLITDIIEPGLCFPGCAAIFLRFSGKPQGDGANLE